MQSSLVISMKHMMRVDCGKMILLMLMLILIKLWIQVLMLLMIMLYLLVDLINVSIDETLS